MKINIITVGKPGNVHYSALTAMYQKRLQRYFSLSVIHTRDVAAAKQRPQEIMRREALLLQKKLPERGKRIVLDQHGTALSSEKFAAFLEKNRSERSTDLSFIIGGPYGLDPSIKALADITFSLSSMTLVHELALVVLLEQIYRGATLMSGKKYHK